MTYSLYLAGILAAGIAAQWLAWRLRLPAIVLLLAFGLLLGNFSDHESGTDPDLFFALISLAVGIVLFEGGLSLDFHEIHGVRGTVIRLVSIGLIITWLLGAFFAHVAGGFSIEMAILIGALLTVSGPTVILPLLRHVQPVRRIGSISKWEGIVNDPIGAVLAALVFELILYKTGSHIATESLLIIGKTLFWGITSSCVAAWIIVQMLRRYWVPDFLHNPVILSFVLITFAISNDMQSESGLVAVTLLGIILANQRTVAIRHVVEFKENLRVLLIAILFIVLASRLEVDMEVVRTLGWRSLLFVGLLIAIVRPIAVFASTIGSTLTWGERAFLAWIHPRGIVAAAVSSLFALQLERILGPEHALTIEAERFVLTTFLVIIGTVVVYGLSLSALSHKLGLSRDDPQGILFAGASRAIREIALAVMKEGYTVLLVDTNPRNNSAARMAGLQVSFASIGSEFVKQQIDLGGIGRLLAMTANDEVNTLAAMGFAERFGSSEVYQVATAETSSGRTERVGAYRRGRTLFDKPVTVEQLEKRLASGAVIKKTLISSDFTFDDFRARYGDSALVLFRIDENGKLEVATSEKELTLRPGNKLIALVDEVEEKKAKQAPQAK